MTASGPFPISPGSHFLLGMGKTYSAVLPRWYAPGQMLLTMRSRRQWLVGRLVWSPCSLYAVTWLSYKPHLPELTSMGKVRDLSALQPQQPISVGRKKQTKTLDSHHPAVSPWQQSSPPSSVYTLDFPVLHYNTPSPDHYPHGTECEIEAQWRGFTCPRSYSARVRNRAQEFPSLCSEQRGVVV